MIPKIRLLIADDHAGVRRGLRLLINSEPGIEVVGEAVDGTAAVEQVLALQPDILLLDMSMPGLHGLEVIRRLQEIVTTTRIIVLTAFAEERNMYPALKAGAFSYVFKDASPNQLLQVIDEVNRGQAVIVPEVAVKLMRDIKAVTTLPPTSEPLTAFEFKILSLLASGESQHVIDSRCAIYDVLTARVVGRILAKVHIANATRTALFVQRVTPCLCAV